MLTRLACLNKVLTCLPATSILTASVDTSIATDVHLGGTSEAPQVATVVDLTEETSNEHQSLNTVEDVVQANVSYCKDHIESLRCFQQYFVKGRALDVVGEAQVNEGKTNFIIVDRQNLIETAFDEILALPEFRKTLEVQFYGKVYTGILLVVLGTVWVHLVCT